MIVPPPTPIHVGMYEKPQTVGNLCEREMSLCLGECIKSHLSHIFVVTVSFFISFPNAIIMFMIE